MADEKQRTWRRVSIPSSLIGATKPRIEEWARSKLNGEEANLKRAEILGISDGTVKEVLLKPKKAGFFLPSGEFIESMGPIKLSEDLEEADSQMEALERDNAWADEECKRFNPPDGKNVRALWEHGERIAVYVAESGRPPFTIHKLLARRRGRDGYRLRAHQTASYLFEWRPNADSADPIFGWTWELVDAVLKFSQKTPVRDSVANLVEKELLPRHVPLGIFVAFLRGPKDKRGGLWERGDAPQLGQLRDELKTTGALNPDEVEKLCELLLNAGTE